MNIQERIAKLEETRSIILGLMESEDCDLRETLAMIDQRLTELKNQ